jgi:hypothetical protein
MTVAKFSKILLFPPAVTDRRYSLLMPERLRHLEWLFERNSFWSLSSHL